MAVQHVLQWPERIRKCDEVITALNSVRQTFVAAQLYEKQQKKDLLSVSTIVTRINAMLAGVSGTLSTTVEDVVTYLSNSTGIDNNISQWPFDWGPADQVFSTDPYGHHGMAIDPTGAATPGNFYLSKDSAGADVTTVDFFDASAGWGVDAVFEVYNAEDAANNRQYKVSALYGGATIHGVLVASTSGWIKPPVLNTRDTKMRIRLITALI